MKAWLSSQFADLSCYQREAWVGAGGLGADPWESLGAQQRLDQEGKSGVGRRGISKTLQGQGRKCTASEAKGQEEAAPATPWKRELGGPYVLSFAAVRAL